MSKTLANTRKAVRELLRDTNPQNYSIPTLEMNDAIQRRVHALAGELRLGVAYSTPITLVSGTSDYTLSATTNEYHGIFQLILVSQNWEIQKVTPLKMEQFRQGTTDAAGDPYVYTLLEDAGQDVLVRFYPTPNKADTVSTLLSTIPQTFVDATEIPFDNNAIAALEYDCAVELGMRAGISPDLIMQYSASASHSKYWSKVRVGRQRRVGNVMPRTW